MEITVKTLDSQTKTFNVSNETTVREFKAKIADEMKIPVEKQRLIFQGKVLQDEKPLQEYKVDGCVVHLVERQPPRTTRPNGQSTETTTSSTPTTSSPGNMFMGAFALPVDVMGVTQQIVQGIIQQIGAESAQANISTSSSDDGSSVNVHINLSTVMARNDARSRIAPARIHLNNVSRILHRLLNDGMPSSRDLDEESSSTERPPGNAAETNNNENSLGDLADVLQQVVRLNDEIRPHLERYQELLRSGTERELRPADDLLPDLAAEALHSLSHAYHALSDVTTNFHVPEPRLNVLPSMSPVPASIARNTPSSNSQPQATTSSTSASAQTTGVNTGVPSGIPIGIGLRPGGGLGTGIGLRTGRGLGPGFSLRPGFTLRPGNGMGSTFGSRNGLPTGIGLVPGSGGLGTGSPAVTVPPTTTTTSTSGSSPRPPNPQQNPFGGLPINFRNLPNFAVQFNPASGNITIAHIVTTVVEEPSLRTTTTTTNSTPSPRTSSRGSNQVTPTPQGGGPPDHTPVPRDESPTPQDGNPAPRRDSLTSQNGTPPSQRDSPTPQGAPPGDSGPQDMDTRQSPPASSAASTSPSRTDGQSADRSAETNAVVNFMPAQSAGHRDPLLPCQSFHFASLVARPNGRSGASQVPGGGQTIPRSGAQRPEPEGQSRERPSVISVSGADGTPEVVDLAQLFNVSQQRAAAATAASSANTNRADRNPFLDLFMSAPQSQETISRNTADEYMMHMAATIEERRRAMTPEELAEERASAEGQGTLSRYLNRLLATIPISQLLMNAVTSTSNPYALTRTMTREFLRDDILGGAEPTAENLQRATERILDELQETFQSAFALCEVKENIDAPATLLTYLRPKIRRLLEIVNSSESEAAYLTEVSSLVSRLCTELVALTEYCLQDGRAGMESALRRSFGLTSAISTLDPALRNMAVDTLWACITDVRGHGVVRESALLPFVVRKERRKSATKKPDSASPKAERKEAKKEESPKARSSDTPRAVPSNTPSSSRRTRSSSQPEDTPMETDENWKKVIPAEWVPVISQDIIRQQRMPRQPPFSDAYLNGMPPKRRKIQQSSEPAPYNQCVSATLKRSITKAGVTPKTDVEKMNEEANSSQSLERVFEDEVKSEVRKRLATDTDYNSEKFPSIHKYFEKDEKR